MASARLCRRCRMPCFWQRDWVRRLRRSCVLEPASWIDTAPDRLHRLDNPLPRPASGPYRSGDGAAVLAGETARPHHSRCCSTQSRPWPPALWVRTMAWSLIFNIVFFAQFIVVASGLIAFTGKLVAVTPIHLCPQSDRANRAFSISAPGKGLPCLHSPLARARSRSRIELCVSRLPDKRTDTRGHRLGDHCSEYYCPQG